MTEPTETITIPKGEYDQMKRRIAKLDALEAGGVGDWEWYGDSLAEWYKAENGQ